MREGIHIALWLMPVALQASVTGQHSFTENASERGIEAFNMASGLSGGIAAADFDGDGDVDLFVPNGLGFPDQLYVNQGDGSFEEQAAAMGLDSFENHRGALWFDIDGDRDLDLIVCGDAFGKTPNTGASSIMLYRQVADGTFVNETVESGLAGDRNLQPDTQVGGMCAADFDGDCDLDFYIGFWEGRSYLFQNDGSGTFEDVTVAAGLGAEHDYWQPVAFDVNGDGWIDIFHAVDFGLNQLWINQHDGTFVDQAIPAGVFNPWNEMGVALGDYDGDGDFDIYVTNQFLGGRHNLLFRNETLNGSPIFDEVSVPLGVADGGCGWGATFVDGSCRGVLDLATTNTNQCPTVVSRYFKSSAGASPVFAEMSDVVGFDDSEEGTGLVACDFDLDGDIDLALACRAGPLLLFDNQLTGTAGTQHHLIVRPRMRGSNTHAIGAVVRVTSGGATQLRIVTAGTSLLSQEPAEAHFGLGLATTAEVTIVWPGGRTTHHGTFSADQVLVLTPDIELDCASPGPARGVTRPGSSPAPTHPSRPPSAPGP